MSGLKFKAVGLALLVVMSGTFAGFGCSKASIASLPYIPTAYYASIEVGQDELLGAYFEPDWGNVDTASKAYNNLAFIFKDVKISQYMLTDSANGVFNLGNIRCKELLGGTVATLKPGDEIDVVGTDRGVLAGTQDWLSFTECIFLPANSANIPAPGSPKFVPSY